MHFIVSTLPESKLLTFINFRGDFMVTIDNTAYNCLLEYAITIIRGKWIPVILCTISDKTLRYNELFKNIENISHKMLSEKLKELEKNNIITRTSYNEIPPRVEYALTVLGLELYDILQNLRIWTEKYLSLS